MFELPEEKESVRERSMKLLREQLGVVNVSGVDVDQATGEPLPQMSESERHGVCAEASIALPLVETRCKNLVRKQTHRIATQATNTDELLYLRGVVAGVVLVLEDIQGLRNEHIERVRTLNEEERRQSNENTVQRFMGTLSSVE